MEILVLEKYIQQAEKAFDENDHMEGMRVLEEALTLEPYYGKAHNHMGWLYIYHVNDWDKAETHLKLALQYAPAYSAPYIHMAHILFERRRFDELNRLLQKALQGGVVQRSFIHNEMGRMSEVKGKLHLAIRYYKKAIRWTFNEREMNVYKDNIRRCRDKRLVLLF